MRYEATFVWVQGRKWWVIVDHHNRSPDDNPLVVKDFGHDGEEAARVAAEEMNKD